MADQASSPGPHSLRFAERLRRLREERGFGAARHFAQALGIRENRYTRYERGASEPDIELIYNFCDKLGITPNELFGIGDCAPATASTQPPGFSAGPQAQFAGAQANSAIDGALTGQAAPRGADLRGRPDRDAAALHLARLATSALYAGSAQAEAKAPLAHLAETARLYQALRGSPFETIARLLVEPALQEVSPAVAVEIEVAVGRFVSSHDGGGGLG